MNNEVVRLVGLSLVAFGVFAFTRHMAAGEQQLEARIAAVWFERGNQYLQAGETAKATQAFRKATADIGDNRKYVLALASALAAENQAAEAEQLLLRLRESDPEDSEINTNLARLAAKQGRVQDAVHYYQNALYGRWTGDESTQRRQLRAEMIRFLLAHQQHDLASSELLILQARTPDTATGHIEVAKLFEEADDQQHALQDFEAAARLDNHNAAALAGAGEVAFQLGDYAKADQYLRATLELSPDSERARHLLDLTQAVQREDPLAARLNAGDRQKILLADLELSSQRLDGCLSQTSDGKASVEMKSLKDEATTLGIKLKGKAPVADFDVARSGVDLVFRMQQVASAYCGKPAVEDQALLLIGRQHAGERP